MKDRRTFLRLMAGTGITVGLVATGQEGHGDNRKRTFKGTSKTGNMQEALHNAISAAERSVRHPDAMVTWTLKSVTGRSGGIAGFNEVAVTIEADVN
jgi:hypothetical protein